MTLKDSSEGIPSQQSGLQVISSSHFMWKGKRHAINIYLSSWAVINGLAAWLRTGKKRNMGRQTRKLGKEASR